MARITDNGRTLRFQRGIGFTLVELLVATAVFALVLAVFLQGFVVAQSQWKQVFDGVSRRQSARTALAQITRDLAQVRLPVYQTPAVTPTSGTLSPSELALQFVLNPTDGSVPSAFMNPHCAFWQAAAPVLATTGDTTVLGYFVRWDTSDPAKPRPVLCRMAAEPGSPDNLLAGATNVVAPSQWLTGDVITSAAPGTTLGNYKGWLADNIIGLFIRALGPTGQPITATAQRIQVALPTTSQPIQRVSFGATQPMGYAYDSRLGYSFARSGATVNVYPPSLPSSLEIAVVAISSSAVNRLTQPLDYDTLGLLRPSNPAAFDQDIDRFLQALPADIQRDAQVFRTTVPLSLR